MGINGGLAAVGWSGRPSLSRSPLGDMTNVAARLQGSAAPGTIVERRENGAAADAAVRAGAIGELTLKGRRGAGHGLAGAPPQDLQRRPLAGAAGRQGDRGRPAEAYRRRPDRRPGQSLLLVGDAGIGKSRLLAELHDRAGDGVTWLEGDCRSYGAAGLYWPFVQMMRAWLGVEPADREIVVRMRMRARLPALYDDPPADPLFFLGHLLSVQPDADERERIRRHLGRRPVGGDPGGVLRVDHAPRRPRPGGCGDRGPPRSGCVDLPDAGGPARPDRSGPRAGGHDVAAGAGHRGLAVPRPRADPVRPQVRGDHPGADRPGGRRPTARRDRTRRARPRPAGTSWSAGRRATRCTSRRWLTRWSTRSSARMPGR